MNIINPYRFSASAFDPSTVSGLVLAVGGRFPQTLDTSTAPPNTVSELKDFGGNANNTMQQLTKLRQPIWDTSKSPYAGVKFDGDSNASNADWIECASNTAIAPVDTATFFAIISSGFTQTGSFRHIARKWDDTGSQGWNLQTDATTSSPCGARLLVNNTPTAFSGGNIITSSKVLLAFTINAGVTATYTNGATATAGTYTVGAGVANTKPLTLGARDTGASPFNGHIYELLQYNRVLNSTEIDTVRAGLNATWGIY